MRSTSYDAMPPRTGLPRWALLAVTPLVLAVGFVSGIALATYRPLPEPPAPPASRSDLAPQEPAGGDPGASAPIAGTDPAPESPPGGLQESPDPRRSGVIALLPEAIDDPFPGSARPTTPTAPPEGPVTTSPAPSTAYHTAPVRTLSDARAALAAEFSSFQVGDRTLFSVDYQVARDANYNTVLIGIIKIAEYSEWVRATREHPSQLQSWLRAAARRVSPAATEERFTLTWTIYEKVNDPPFGFAAREVTRDPRGGYVVTRLLAAVTDPARALVSIAAPESPVAASENPWSAYGPVIRFDSTDLYRPTATSP
ncbi:MAG: hypothetical protein ACOY93_22285 [Bacillota bacterium]